MHNVVTKKKCEVFVRELNNMQERNFGVEEQQTSPMTVLAPMTLQYKASKQNHHTRGQKACKNNIELRKNNTHNIRLSIFALIEEGERLLQATTSIHETKRRAWNYVSAINAQQNFSTSKNIRPLIIDIVTIHSAESVNKLDIIWCLVSSRITVMTWVMLIASI